MALLGLASAQAQVGMRVGVLASWKRGDTLELAEPLRSAGVEVTTLGPCSNKFQRCGHLRAAIAARISQADIVHIHGVWEDVIHQAAVVAREANVPYGITPHGMLDAWSLRRHYLRKALYLRWRLRRDLDWASFVHYTTDTEQASVARLSLGTPPIVEPLGLDLSEFESLPPRGSFRGRYPAVGDCPVVMFLGRIHPGKGLEYLIPAFAEGAPDRARLIVVGPDSTGYRAQMERLAKSCGISDRVIFTGLMAGRDRVAALVDADLFALPSDHENFGVAVVEALAAGTPVIISDQVSIHGRVSAAGVGAVVPTEIRPLAQQLRRWLGDPALREAAASRARGFVWQNYDWIPIARHWLEHYQRFGPRRWRSALAAAGESSERSREKASRLGVLHVIWGLNPADGGPVTALTGMIRAQLDIGLDVSVFATWRTDADLPLVESLRRAGARVRMVGPARTRLRWHRASAAHLRDMICQVDVVHIHGLWEEPQHLAARIAREQGVRYIIRPCGMLDPWSLRKHAIRKRIYLHWRLGKDLAHAAALHFTNDQGSAVLQQLDLHVPVIVEPNGVDLAEFEHLPPRGTFRRQHPRLADRPMLIFLGRIHPGKGLEYLIPAFAQLPERDTVLVVAGPDSNGHRLDLERMAASFGLTDRVIFTGMLYGGERVAALTDADLFALPSEHENFGIAVVEALAAGCPVIVSDQVGIHREITEAGVGAAVPLAIEPLARELHRWLADPQLRRAAAERARPFVWENYDWQRIAERWCSQYDRLIGAMASVH